MRVLVGARGQSLVQRLVALWRTPLYRNGYLLTLSSGGSTVLGFIFWIIAARLYPPAVIGEQSALLSAMMLLAGISIVSLNNVLVRYLPVAGRDGYRLVWLSYVISSAVAIIVSCVFLLGLRWWLPALAWVGADPRWFAVFVFATVVWCVFSLQDYVLIGLRQSQWIPLENLTFSAVKLGLLVVGLPLFAVGGIFLAWNIPVLLSILPVNLLIFRRVLPAHIRAVPAQPAELQTPKIIRFAAGNYLAALFYLAYTNLLPLIVVNLAGPETSAHFYLPWTIFGGLQLLALNMTTSLTVEATYDRLQLTRFFRRVMSQVTRILIPVVGLILLGAPYILRVFGADYGAEGSVLLRWLALATLPNVIVMLGLAIGRVEERPRLVAAVQGAVSIVGLGLSVLLLPWLGIVGIGIAWLFCQTAVALVLVFTVLRPLFQTAPDAPVAVAQPEPPLSSK